MSILSNIIALPLILFLSIPLIISALVTIPLAITGLLLRVLLVYMELGVALLRSYVFLFPEEESSFPGVSSTSFLTFSGANTPGAGLPSSKGNSFNNAKGDDYFGRVHRSDRLTPSKESTIFNFVSGDEGRDFEGVGGWRSPVLRKKPTLSPGPSSIAGSVESLGMTEKDGHGYSRRNSLTFDGKDEGDQEYVEGTVSGIGATEYDINDASNEIDFDADASDERAWLSLNQRLELPSQPVPLTLAYSPSNITGGSHNVSAAAEQGSSSQPRHHRRAVTTSSLSPGLSLSPYYYGMGSRRSRSRSNSGSGPGPTISPTGEQQQQQQHQQYQHHHGPTSHPGAASVSHHYHHQVYYHHYYNHNNHQHHHGQNSRHNPPPRTPPAFSATKSNLETSRSSAGLESLAPLPPLSSSFLINKPDIRGTKKGTNNIPSGNSSTSSRSSSNNNSSGGTGTGKDARRMSTG